MTFARTMIVCLPLALLVALPVSRAPAEANPTAAGATEAVACVERLHGVLLDVMKNAESLGYGGRVSKLEPAVSNSYNLEFMARKSVGRHWKDMNEEERARFLGLFSELTVANYAGRFTGWSGEEFETLGLDPGVHDTLLVKTRIVRPSDEDVTLDYRLNQTPEDGWRIIDVYMNGTISELAMRRSEYSAMLRREGFTALVEALDKKITGLREG
jgi:phospholipid transport system substrate-binding protein